jgi:hypothetical protein
MARLSFLLALTAASVLALSACGQNEPASGPAETPAGASSDTGPAPEMPLDAPPQEEAPVSEAERTGVAEGTCRDTIGEAASARLVERCIALSAATRPPCNAINPCALIQDEIDRSCRQFPANQTPAECAA